MESGAEFLILGPLEVRVAGVRMRRAVLGHGNRRARRRLRVSRCHRVCSGFGERFATDMVRHVGRRVAGDPAPAPTEQTTAPSR
jgi:hypothetical protein